MNPTAEACAEVRAYQQQRRAEHLWLAEKNRQLRVLDDVIAETLAETSEREAQQLARTHGYHTAAIRGELHRWDCGCFSKQPFARTHVRQLERALDIACEHHAMKTAAE